ncbi:MAG: hypothetical protein AAGG57_03030 [Pseudomonadota bacterium]
MSLLSSIYLNGPKILYTLQEEVKYAESNDASLKGEYIERMLADVTRSLEASAKRDNLISLAGLEEKSSEQLAPEFELGVDDRTRALNLAPEIKSIVNSSETIDRKHKVRPVKRISAIEIELHKMKGNYNVILGGVSDFGGVLGKFGKDVKPLIDRMKDIRDLTRSKTSEYDQLPPPDETKELPHPSDFDEG